MLAILRYGTHKTIPKNKVWGDKYVNRTYLENTITT